MPEWKLERARQMRRNPTFSERILWKHLRGRQRSGYRFGRQRLLKGYIADFYCPSLKLVIEVDGPCHNVTSDAFRDKVLAHEGIQTLRIPAQLVFDDISEALSLVDQCLAGFDRKD